MLKTLSPYSTTAKTAEIMSRYRPIAPKPEPPANSLGESSSMSQKIRQSPYLRNLWPQLQARPTRTRKRGRAAISPPTIKRPRTTHFLGLSSPGHLITSARDLSLRGFAHGISQLPVANLAGVNSTCLENPVTTSSDLVTLSLLPCQPSVPAVAPEISCMERRGEKKVIDLNIVAEIPEDKDLLQQLQEPPASLTNVIAPQPIRPVGSRISVGCITEDPNLAPSLELPKKPGEVEEEVESEALPAVISDSNYKVRLANSAYKEMVGQPECLWLDSMITGDGRFVGGSCKRICGEVMLNLDGSRVPVSSNGFSCWVRIEWGHEGKKKAINSFCDVIRLSCESKDYLYIWRFHTQSREVLKPAGPPPPPMSEYSTVH
ncbi:hypothetical protein JCGZ_16015 [Jatropha curcas]|uniref:DUF7950 domain-containing protein n=1 Tax=Jatropha curcas TaxID=180498 RepID=A0A067L305_JATCU|nr:uncharacterized protein LOC105630835 [Jatropha curcas]KDP41608.1 hypothetical protein JCGZ_16015 [Jatropha curcas]